MCGIAGILRVWASGDVPRPLDAIPESWLDILDESIKHRGPDGRGRFRQRVVRSDGAVVDVALVHRRLSIIDHAGGAQPMVLGTAVRARVTGECDGHGGSSAGAGPLADRGSGVGTDAASTPPLLAMEGAAYARVCPHNCPACEAIAPGVLGVVFNGCIYNHRELRRELQAEGHEFVSDHSDTEVLLHGWRQWGPELLDRLDGMYAAAVWDGCTARILLLRDRFGEKPLYSSSPERGGHELGAPLTAWSSSHAGLMRWRRAMGLEPLGDDLTTLRGWAKFGWNQAGPACEPRPQFIGQCQPVPEIRDVPRERISESLTVAAHDSLSHNAGWWGGALSLGIESPSEATVDAVLRAAVQSRLEADVPLGCFLSGGIDSALITRYASEVRPDLTAFTVRMPVASMDESAAAAATARHLNVRHETLDCDARPAEDVVALIQQLGLPFGDSSLLPTLWVSRAARGRVKVALAGDGGDELFLGYDRHRAIEPIIRASRSPAVLRRFAARVARADREPRSRASRASRLLAALNGKGYKELVAIFPHPLDREAGISAGLPMEHFGMTPTGRRDTTWSWALRFDRHFYLPEDLLRKTDTASMSVALEVRAPFLANEVAQLAFNASPASLMPRGQRKGLLRAVARKYLPADIVDRPKMGFAIPISDWFRTNYGGMRQLLLDHLNAPDPFPGLADSGIDLSMAFVRRMIKEHDDAGARSLWPWKGRDHGQRLYMLLVLSIWCRWLERMRRGG